ncbi:MAG TPA: hypothetical protein VNF29_04795 [Candidatus Binataceae bacterium]|nr:hypothetical protein [Candidatus Binataceae bacterium]
MANQRGIRHGDTRHLIGLESAAPERVDLELEPREHTVASFEMTRAAERSWEILNRASGAPAGAMFWITGPAGSGKTHFLNYVLALESRAATPTAEPGRHLVCGFELAGRILSREVEAFLLDTLAEQIGAERESLSLWREMRGADAIALALEHARRTGVRALTIAIDFSASEAEPPPEYFAALANLARTSKILRLTIIGASRARPPEAAIALSVAPANRDELMRVAIARGRVASDAAQGLIHELYAGVDTRGFDPHAIFPFHPLTVRALGELADPPGTVGAAARLAREALASELDSGAGTPVRLIYRADLMDSLALARRIEARMGDAGRAALRAALEALAMFHGNERMLAREIVHALAIDYALGDVSPKSFAQLEMRVPMLAGDSVGGAAGAPAVAEIIRRLEGRTAGAVRADRSGAALFDPGAALAPEVARFNAALPLLARFDPTLEPARDADSRHAAAAALAEALAGAVEGASRTGATLAAALAEVNLVLPAEQVRVLADYAALAEAGVERLIETAADPARREAALKTISFYEGLEAAAQVAPRMRAMREFAEATGLRIPSEDQSAHDPRVAALETECHLLLAELAPRKLTGVPRGLDALEARFQKFKWTYVQLYRSLHGAWKTEMDRVAMLADDARRRLDALGKLDAIGALGPALGAAYAAQFEELRRRVIACERGAAGRIEVTPRCEGCGYVIGTPSPRAELEDLAERLDRALHVKLAALSHSAISRLVREHDRSHRLDGFLKIIQAAQTDALARVLDDKLARYLARLLDENLGAETGGVELKALANPPPAKSSGLRAARRRDHR